MQRQVVGAAIGETTAASSTSIDRRNVSDL
jgi:hypothetical protein